MGTALTIVLLLLCAWAAGVAGRRGHLGPELQRWLWAVHPSTRREAKRRSREGGFGPLGPEERTGPADCGADRGTPGPGQEDEPPGGTEWPGVSVPAVDPADEVLGRVLAIVRANREYCYVLRQPGLVNVATRRGGDRVIVVTPVPRPGHATLSADGETLLVDGEPVAGIDRAEGYRKLFCLTRATYRGPNGEPSGHYVTTLDRLADELLAYEPQVSRAELDALVENHWSREWTRKRSAMIVHEPRREGLGGREERATEDRRALSAEARERARSALAPLSESGCHVFENLPAASAGVIDHLVVGPAGCYLVIVAPDGGLVWRRESGALYLCRDPARDEETGKLDGVGYPYPEDLDARGYALVEELKREINAWAGWETGPPAVPMGHFLCFPNAEVKPARGLVSVWTLASAVTSREVGPACLDPRAVEEVAAAVAERYGKAPRSRPGYPEGAA